MAETIATHKYVSIKDGVVVSVFDGYQLPEYNEEMIDIRDITNKNPRPDHFWTYDAITNTYTAPPAIIPPTEAEILAQAKKAKSDIISQDRFRYITPSSILYMGHEFELTVVTYLNVSEYSSSAGLTGTLPDNFGWIDKDDNFVPMTMSQFKGFVTLIANRMFEGYSTSAIRKAELKLATTLAEIDAI